MVVPKMPETGMPKIKAWVGKLKEIAKSDGNTIFVGHSIGCQAILRYVETLPKSTKIPGVVLIAPWMALDAKTIEEEGEEVKKIAKPWMETPINFKKVKSHVGKIIAIFSDNDPYVPIGQKELFKKELAAEIIIEHGLRHFTIGDGVAKLPSALKAILKMTD